MAGLNAAWRLDKRGFRDFVLLEMERQAGGNSRWGENEISEFPWAAHYVPVPAKGESLARELFEELGVFRDGKWDERVLCFDPQERLFINGHWQEGIEPEDGATPRDRAQFRRFMQTINEFRATGQFTVPMERGAKPSPLDQDVDGRLARAAGLRFRASALVHQLRLPRRLRRAGERHFGVGGHSIFCVARAGGKGSADVAGRQRLDRGSIDRKAEAIFADRRRGVSCRAQRQQDPRAYRADRIHRGRCDLGRSDVPRVLHRRRRAARRRVSILALAYRESDARSHSGSEQSRTRVGQRDLRFAHAGLRERDAHEPGDAHRSDGVDVLLVAGRAHAG